MRVISIDPGYDRCGIAVLEKDVRGKEVLIYSACIETKKTQAHHERLAHVATTFQEAVRTYSPTILAIETLFFNKNVSTALKVAEVRGSVIAIAVMHGLEVMELSPQAVKIAVTGYGNADKTAVTTMITRLLSLASPLSRDDEYDAVAAGIACLASYRYPRF